MFTLNGADLVKGVVMAVFSAVITYLYMATQVAGFSFSTVDINAIGTVAAISAISYLFKNFVSDGNGSVAGVIG